MFDTNVIVAGLVAEGLCREIVETHLPEHTATLADPLWDELVEKLRSKFDLVTEELPLLSLYRRHAERVQAQPLRSSRKIGLHPKTRLALEELRLARE